MEVIRTLLNVLVLLIIIGFFVGLIAILLKPDEPSLAEKDFDFAIRALEGMGTSDYDAVPVTGSDYRVVLYSPGSGDSKYCGSNANSCFCLYETNKVPKCASLDIVPECGRSVGLLKVKAALCREKATPTDYLGPLFAGMRISFKSEGGILRLVK